MKAIFIPCFPADISKIINMIGGYGKPITIFRNHKLMKEEIVFIRMPLGVKKVLYPHDHRIGTVNQRPKDLF